MAAETRVERVQFTPRLRGLVAIPELPVHGREPYMGMEEARQIQTQRIVECSRERPLAIGIGQISLGLVRVLLDRLLALAQR
jgi:hypothetical protein